MESFTNDQRRVALNLLRSTDPISRSAEPVGVSEQETPTWIAAYLTEKASLGPAEVRTAIIGRALIVRDRRGVPHISAEDPAYLFLALGYAQAQDRLWQLDYLRR